MGKFLSLHTKDQTKTRWDSRDGQHCN